MGGLYPCPLETALPTVSQPMPVNYQYFSIKIWMKTEIIVMSILKIVHAITTFMYQNHVSKSTLDYLYEFIFFVPIEYIYEFLFSLPKECLFESLFCRALEYIYESIFCLPESHSTNLFSFYL